MAYPSALCCLTVSNVPPLRASQSTTPAGYDASIKIGSLSKASYPDDSGKLLVQELK